MAKERFGADGEFYRHVGTQVRRLRMKAGLKQDDLATRVDMSRASIANVEAGKQAVPLHQFAAIAEALGTDVGSLLPPKAEGHGVFVSFSADAPPAVMEFLQNIRDTP